ncbi:uncharacterized protein medag [Mastacembelus armatus]|uniref:Uncharacterized LOC113143359 n=1 Tax=Mastacembelus armatus TaxID=205130 RepID=A0A3Q3MB92_9TELE|nr:uncharacterized protein LOC113143359 [Mastacembelus armatus]
MQPVELASRRQITEKLLNMSLKKVSHSRLTVTEMEEFLKKPPAGFCVERLDSGSGYVIHSDPQNILVFIDDFDDCKRRIIFNNSQGRTFKMRNLGEYTKMRNRLLSSKIYLMVSACEGNVSSKEKAATEPRVLKQFMVCVNGGDSFVQWHMAKGLDWAISSVAGESYRLKIDLTDAMESWAAKNNNLLATGGLKKHKIVWRDVFFTLKYSSDALFDFPKMFGCSKRTFKLKLT